MSGKNYLKSYKINEISGSKLPKASAKLWHTQMGNAMRLKLVGSERRWEIRR